MSGDREERMGSCKEYLFDLLGKDGCCFDVDKHQDNIEFMWDGHRYTLSLSNAEHLPDEDEIECIFGAVVGDIVGSVFEHEPIKEIQFSFFSKRGGYTDDTVLTVAIAQAILTGGDYGKVLAEFARKYTAGYGSNFYDWAHSDKPQPYNSWGNGSAMRVSPIGFAFDSVEQVLAEAEKTALPTHNHPEGIKGAQATALAIYLARTGATREEIKEEISSRFDYDLDRTLEEIRPFYHFKIACQESVPESIIAFLESTDFEGAVRNAVSLGGDADTMACITGSIAQAFYGGVPADIARQAREKLPREFLEVQEAFARRFFKG